MSILIPFTSKYLMPMEQTSGTKNVYLKQYLYIVEDTDTSTLFVQIVLFVYV